VAEFINLMDKKTIFFRQLIIKESSEAIQKLNEFKEEQQIMKPIQTSMLSFLTEENEYMSNTIVPATQDNNTSSTNSTINQFQATLGTTNQFMPIVNSTITSQEYFNPLPSPMYENNLESIMAVSANDKTNEIVAENQAPAKPPKNIGNNELKFATNFT